MKKDEEHLKTLYEQRAFKRHMATTDFMSQPELDELTAQLREAAKNLRSKTEDLVGQIELDAREYFKDPSATPEEFTAVVEAMLSEQTDLSADMALLDPLSARLYLCNLMGALLPGGALTEEQRVYLYECLDFVRSGERDAFAAFNLKEHDHRPRETANGVKIAREYLMELRRLGKGTAALLATARKFSVSESTVKRNVARFKDVAENEIRLADRVRSEMIKKG